MRTAPAQEQSTHEASAYEAEATRWASAGRPDQAACFYAATLDHRPGDTRVRMMLAACLVRCNRIAAAAGEYLRVALEYAGQRRDQEALALAYQVLHLDASQLVYVAVADVLRRIGRPARELCARAAEAHLQAGRLVDGLHMLQLGAEIDARNPAVRRRLAQIYLSQHMVGPAVANLAEAGRLLLAAGNNAEYVEVAELILRADPRHLETLRELPRVYLRVGEPQRAVVKLADLMRVSPGDTVGYETLAHAFAVIGRIPTALSVLERLTTELTATGRAPQAGAILERARSWRLDDPEFARAVLALREPKPAAARPQAPVRAPQAHELQQAPMGGRPASESTVVLDITDLLVSGDIAAAVAAHPRPGHPSVPPQAARRGTPGRSASAPESVLDLSSDDLIELEEVEGTLVLRMQDLSTVGRVPRRPAGPPPAPRKASPPRVAAPPVPPQAAPTRVEAPPVPRQATPPRRPDAPPAPRQSAPRRPDAPPAPRQAAPRRSDAPPAPRQPASMPAPRRLAPPPAPRRLAAELESTELVGLDDTELDEITLVRPMASFGDLTALVHDDDSAELHDDPRSPAARAAMVRRARELAGRAHAYA